MSLLLENLEAGYRGHVRLRIPSFRADEKSILILGRSGSGKSTLLKVLGGILVPYRGEVQILGRRLLAQNPRFRRRWAGKVGFVFQEGALFDSLTVRENLLFPLRRYGVPRTAWEERIQHALQAVSLEPEVLPRYPAELSGGMRRRVGLARALIFSPEVLLVDEPTMGLDPITSRRILDLIRGLLPAVRLLVVATHDLLCVQHLGERILLLEGGQPLADLPRERALALWAGAPPADEGESAFLQFVRGEVSGPLVPA